MDSRRWENIKDLFDRALDLSPEDRNQFFTEACRGASSLRAEVEELLGHDRPTSFVDQSLAQLLGSAVSRNGPNVTFQVGEVIAGRFRIVGFIGRGGMGEVYEAEDLELAVGVALKTLRPEISSNPEALKWFRQEVQMARRVTHPNVCRMFDIAGHNAIGRAGTPSTNHVFLTMELLHGEPLSERLRRTGRMSIEYAWPIVRQIGAALQSAHEAEVIHRDFKPSNVLLVPNQPSGTGGIRAVVTDFGLARGMRSLLSVDGEYGLESFSVSSRLMGTPAYMAPEQVEGQPATAASDIYAFGLVLYEIVTGVRPFEGTTPISSAAKRLTQPPPAPRVLVPTVHLNWESVILRCLEREPANRFGTVQEAIKGLAEGIADSIPGSSRAKSTNSPLASPTSTGRSTSATMRRLRSWPSLSVAAVLVCVLAAAPLFVLWMNSHNRQNASRIVQITADNKPKGLSPAFISDGPHLFFWSSYNEGAMQVSVKGGDSAPLFLQTKESYLLDVNTERREFLVCRYLYPGCELWLEPMFGGARRRLGNLFADHDAAVWSPDGRQLAYVRNAELRIARSDGTDIRTLATLKGKVFYPRWSPDGRRIRFSVMNAGSPSQIWEVLIDGTGLRRVLSGWNRSWSACCGTWTPNGKYFIFEANKSLWAVRENAGFFRPGTPTPVQLSTPLLEASQPLPSADGRRIFFVGEQRRNEFMRYDPNSGHFALCLAGISGTELAVSRDGKWVTYVSVPGGALFISGIDGTRRVQLTSPPLQASMPQWSPDGKQIAFSAAKEGEPGRIYAVSFDGGTLRQLTHGEGGEYGDEIPSWSPDGAWLSFGGSFREKPTAQAIHVLELSTNHVSTMPGSEGMYSPRWSPDGRFIAGLYAFGRKLVLYDRRTARQAELKAPPGLYPSWSRDGEHLYFYNSIDTSWWRVRLHDRKLERVADVTDANVADFNWFTTCPDDSLMTARNIGVQEIYALDLERP